MKTNISVRDAMTKRPTVIDPNKSVEECARIMLQNKVGSLIVKEGSKVVGMITEKDFVDKVVAKSEDPKELKAKEIMKEKVITISPDVDIYDAMIKMNKENIRRLPVIENGKMIGFLTHRDILKIQPQLFELCVENISIKEEDSKPVFKSEDVDGECDECGNFTQLHQVKDRLLCHDCS